jgi:hypothetical protein
MIFSLFFYHQPNSYPLVIQQFAIENGHLYIVDLHIEDGYFPSFFVGLPLKMVIFHSFPIKHGVFPVRKLLVYQRVNNGGLSHQ